MAYFITRVFVNALEEIQKALLGQWESGEIYGKARDQVLRTAKDVWLRFPTWQKSAAKWMEQFESGRLDIHVDTGDLNKQIDRVDRDLKQSVRQLLFVLLLVGLLIGSAIISTLELSESGLDFLPIDVFIIMFIAVASIGLI